MQLLLRKSKIYIITILVIVFLLLLIAFFATPLLLQICNLTKINSSVFFINRLFVWIILILLWLFVKSFEKQKLLIWTESERTISFYILSVVIVLIVLFIGNLLITKILGLFTHNVISRKFLDYISLFKTNIPLLIFTALTAAVVEELIFRGYIQTRLENIFKSPVLGIVISSILFAIVHLSYRTLSNFIVPFFIGAVFSFFYWKYKNIKILIFCHFLWDVFALFLSIKLIHTN